MDKLQEYNKAINYVIEEIESGKLIEGSKLPSERDLTETLGISRNSTREAIKILKGVGVVESKAGSGNYIVNNTDRTIKEIVDIMLKLGSITKKEIVDYRRYIATAIGLGIMKNGLSKENEEKLGKIIMSMNEASNEEFARLDTDFHLAFIEATENKLFKILMEPVGETYFDIIYEVAMSSTVIDRGIRKKMHEDLFNSVKNKDVQALLDSIKVHYDYVESKFEF